MESGDDFKLWVRMKMSNAPLVLAREGGRRLKGLATEPRAGRSRPHQSRSQVTDAVVAEEGGCASYQSVTSEPEMVAVAGRLVTIHDASRPYAE